MPSIKNPVLTVQPGPGRLPAGTVPAAALIFPPGGSSDAALQAHITDPVDAHMATAIGGGDSANWYDGTTNPAAPVETKIDKIITDLVAIQGAGRIGANSGANWYDGTTNPAASIEDRLDKVITDLVANAGADRIGANTGPNWYDGTLNPIGSIEARLDKIITDLIAAQGADRIGASASPNWHDGTLNPVGAIKTKLDKIISDLVANAGSDRTGSAAVIGTNISLSAGQSVYDQLKALTDFTNLMLDSRNNIWGGKQTITPPLGVDALLINATGGAKGVDSNSATDYAVSGTSSGNSGIYGKTTDAGSAAIYGEARYIGTYGDADGSGLGDNPRGVQGVGRNPDLGKTAIGVYGIANGGGRAATGLFGKGKNFTGIPTVIDVGAVGWGADAVEPAYMGSETLGAGVLGIGGPGINHPGVIGYATAVASGDAGIGAYFRGANNAGANDNAGSGLKSYGGEGTGGTDSDGGIGGRFFGGQSTDVGGAGDGGYGVEAIGGDAAGTGAAGTGIRAEGGRAATRGGVGGWFYGSTASTAGRGGNGIGAWGGAGFGINEDGGYGLYAIGGDSVGSSDGGHGIYARGGDATSGLHGHGILAYGATGASTYSFGVVGVGKWIDGAGGAFANDGADYNNNAVWLNSGVEFRLSSGGNAEAVNPNSNRPTGNTLKGLGVPKCWATIVSNSSCLLR
jgi:hypothetical protein